MISIVIPTFNEIKNGYIQKSFAKLANLKNAEVLIVDSMSTDGTRELATNYGFTLIDEPNLCRATRLKNGIEKSKGEYIVLHHPRSILEDDFENSITGRWGAFTHQFDSPHPLLKFTSYWSNYVRGKRGIFYLDHCIYLHKDLKETALQTPDVDIFEDTELCLLLRNESPPKLLKPISTTSAIRFTKNGVLKQALLNQWMKWLFYFGIHHKKMNKVYEKDLNLNG